MLNYENMTDLSNFPTVECEDISNNITHGTVEYDSMLACDEGYLDGTVAYFTCDSEYNLLGSSSSACQRELNGTFWNPSPPVCQLGKEVAWNKSTPFVHSSQSGECLTITNNYILEQFHVSHFTFLMVQYSMI